MNGLKPEKVKKSKFSRPFFYLPMNLDLSAPQFPSIILFLQNDADSFFTVKLGNK